MVKMTYTHSPCYHISRWWYEGPKAVFASRMAGLVADSFWKFGGCISLHRFLWGQEKHGHAANTQGACSQICCGESPRALGQKVPLGDRKTLALEPSAKHKWSCGSGVLVLCSSKVMPWAFARTPTERGSLFPCPLPTDVWQRHTSNRVFWIHSWARQTIKRQTVLYTIESRTRLWLLIWWLDW